MTTHNPHTWIDIDIAMEDGGSGACCLGTPRRVSTTLSDVTVIYRICYDSIALPPLSTVHPEVHAALMRSPILITLSPAVSTIARLSRLLTYGSANVSFTVSQLLYCISV